MRERSDGFEMPNVRHIQIFTLFSVRLMQYEHNNS